jgi:hypothetical protein
LIVSWTEKGPKFQIIPDNSGAIVSNLSYSYSLFDSNTRKWEGWTNWNSLNQTTSYIYEPSLIPGKSSIAFAAIASNSCGSSPQARESKNNAGVPFAAQQSQTISIASTTLLSQVTVGNYSIPISSLFKSSSGYSVSIVSATKDTCQVTNQNYLIPSKVGSCTLVASIGGIFNFTKAPDTEYSFLIIPKKKQVINISGDIRTRVLDEGGFSINAISNSNLTVTSSSDTPDVCKRISSFVYILSTGTCALTFSQQGNNTYEPAESKSVTFEVVEEILPITINCTKGKITKKVTAVKPVCPKGYKVKK